MENIIYDSEAKTNDRAKKVIFAVTTLMWFSIYSYQSNFSIYIKSLTDSNIIIGLIVGSYGFSQMLFRIPFGIFSDKLKTRKLFITCGLVFTFISALFLLLSDNVYIILAARTLAGISASVWVNVTVLFTSYFDKNKSYGTLGYLDIFSNSGQILGIVLGVVIYMLSGSNYRASFLLSFIIGIIAFATSFLIYEDKSKIGTGTNTVSVKNLISMFSNKTLITVSLIAAVSQFITFGTIFSFTPLYAKEVLGINNFQNMILVSFSYIPTAFGSFFLSKFFIGRIKEYKLVFIGMILLAANTFLIPLVTSFSLLVITQTIAGIGKGMSFPLLMGLSIKKVESEKKGTAMGIFQAIYGFGMFMGSVTMGIITQSLDFTPAFVIFGVVCFITAVISFFTLKKLQI